MKSKIFGINLISLIIGSALGAFILSVIVRVSFTISNNYQIMKANAELATSARALHNFFMQAFAANGYIENNDTTNTKYNGNAYTVFSDGSNETRFYLWYSAGINGSLWCSGQPAAPIPPSSTSPSPPNTPWFLRVSLSSNILGAVSNPTKCKDKTLAMATGITESDLPPIVSPQQFYDFSLVAIANADPSTVPTNVANSNIVSIKIISSNLNTTLTTYGYNRGIKLAILLKSAKPVFNTARSVSFNVFGTNVAKTAMSQLTTPTDKYLYKLVVIQSPFFYPAKSLIHTVTQLCPSSGGSTCGGYVDSNY